MRWVYILECDDGYFYVGKTKRLYRRFWEHENGRGGVNTSVYEPQNIVAIYAVNKLEKFFEYSKMVREYNLTNHFYFDRNHNIYFNRDGLIEKFNIEYDDCDCLWVENNITEKMMIANKENLKKIRGGKYTRFDVDYTFPTNEFVNELPMCNCGLPCDVKTNEDNNYLYFRCAKKNMWDEMREEFGIDVEPCKFFMKYINDKIFKIEYENRKEKILSLVNASFWLKNLVGCHYEYCVGGCGKEYDSNNTIRYSRKAINLCFECFINKNEELAKKYIKQYKPIGKCLIDL